MRGCPIGYQIDEMRGRGKKTEEIPKVHKILTKLMIPNQKKQVYVHFSYRTASHLYLMLFSDAFKVNLNHEGPKKRNKYAKQES